MWFIADKSLGNSFSQFMQFTYSHSWTNYVKMHYDITGFHTSKISIRNFLTRIINTPIKSINEQFLLPKAIVIVLDDDLLDWIDHYKNRISIFLGKTMEYWQTKCTGSLQITKRNFLVKAESSSTLHFFGAKSLTMRSMAITTNIKRNSIKPSEALPAFTERWTP